ncbi:MAG: cytochrome C biogenesis protein CcmH [Kordiimonas sp.]|nr:cytochrome C biogenesis protein CcmH [Kordiimonas sp.]|tara:strand:+ start:1571 stop:2107 length:537 start_codon:yes stop_codon:yes gene_type:complete
MIRYSAWVSSVFNPVIVGVLLCVVVGGAHMAHAVAVDEGRLADPALEAKAQRVMKELRCLVCQNQAINESNAPLATDLRQIVRERIAAGDNEAEIKEFMVARYGDWVLLQPPFKTSTVLLWIGPLLLAVGGGIILLIFYRQRSNVADVPTLTEAETARVAELMAASVDDVKDDGGSRS